MSRHDFIFSVLTDLAKYAEANDLKDMREAIKQAQEVAEDELTGQGECPPIGVQTHLTLVQP